MATNSNRDEIVIESDSDLDDWMLPKQLKRKAPDRGKGKKTPKGKRRRGRSTASRGRGQVRGNKTSAGFTPTSAASSSVTINLINDDSSNFSTGSELTSASCNNQNSVRDRVNANINTPLQFPHPSNSEKDDTALNNTILELPSISNEPEKPNNDKKDDHETSDTKPPPPVQRTTRRGLAKKNSDLCSVKSMRESHIYSEHVTVFKRLVMDCLQGKADMMDGEQTEGKAENSLEISEKVFKSVSNVVDSSEDIGCKLVENNPSNSNADDGVDVEGEEEVENLRVPTPPPMGTPASCRRRATRMNRKLTSALKALTNAKDSLDKATTPRRRISRRSRQSDVIVLDEESPVKDELLVKVRYLSKIHRINMKLTDCLSSLVSQLSEELSEAEHDLSLFLHDQPLSLNKTVRQTGLSVADIIECYCIIAQAGNDGSVDSIHLYIQCQNKRTRTAIDTCRRLPLSQVMQKYAEDMELGSNNLKFSFDGEQLKLTDTPERLEMDDGDVIDLLIL